METMKTMQTSAKSRLLIIICRHLVLNMSMATLVLTSLACGDSNKDNGGGDAATFDQKSVSLAVSTLTDLPECSQSIESQLVYIKEDKTFQFCSNLEWTEISIKGDDGKDQLVSLIKVETESPGVNCVTGGKAIKSGLDNNSNGSLDEDEIISTEYVCNGIAGVEGKGGINGTDGQDGIRMLSTQRLPSSSTDFCTGVADESCSFQGGQVVRFSDGSRLITGSWSFSYFTAGDSDTDLNAFTFYLGPEMISSFQRLSPLVHRGVGYRSAYLVYTKSPEKFVLSYDSDNNGSDSADTILLTITPEDY